jgi:hypothetical protein
MDNITNPSSTEPTSPFSDIKVESSGGYSVNKYDDPLITIDMNTPGTPTEVELKQETNEAG